MLASVRSAGQATTTAFLTSQMAMVQAYQPSSEVALDFVFSPEMTLMLFILMTYVGWNLGRRWSTTTSTATRTYTETWTMTMTTSSSSTRDFGTQAETTEEKNVFGPLRAEIAGLRQDLRDSDSYNVELKDKCEGLENECDELERQVDELVTMRDFLSGEIGELDGKYKGMRMKWQRAVQTLMDMQHQLQTRPLAHVVWHTRTGNKYHVNAECQGLSNADRNSMKTLEYCAFCAQQESDRWREFTDLDRRQTLQDHR